MIFFSQPVRKLTITNISDSDVKHFFFEKKKENYNKGESISIKWNLRRFFKDI